jgi:hypothetical protein
MKVELAQEVIELLADAAKDYARQLRFHAATEVGNSSSQAQRRRRDAAALEDAAVTLRAALPPSSLSCVEPK